MLAADAGTGGAGPDPDGNTHHPSVRPGPALSRQPAGTAQAGRHSTASAVGRACCSFSMGVGGGIYCGLVLDLTSLDLEEIASALADRTGYEHRWLISLQTREIAFWAAGAGIDGQTPVDHGELDLVCIDPLPSWVWYQDMADFAETITDEGAGRRLLRAIQGKGAFRRFKDELHEQYLGLLPVWYAFRGARATRRAVPWLAGTSLIDHDAADRFLAGHPDPGLP